MLRDVVVAKTAVCCFQRLVGSNATRPTEQKNGCLRRVKRLLNQRGDQFIWTFGVSLGFIGWCE